MHVCNQGLPTSSTARRAAAAIPRMAPAERLATKASTVVAAVKEPFSNFHRVHMYIYKHTIIWFLNSGNFI